MSFLCLLFIVTAVCLWCLVFSVTAAVCLWCLLFSLQHWLCCCWSCCYGTNPFGSKLHMYCSVPFVASCLQLVSLAHLMVFVYMYCILADKNTDTNIDTNTDTNIDTNIETNTDTNTDPHVLFIPFCGLVSAAALLVWFI